MSESGDAPANELITTPLERMTCPSCGAEVDLTGVEPFSKIPCPACEAELTVPAKFGHFLLLRRLGSGGMGTAFLGEDEGLGRKVAIKVMQKALCDDPKAFETFKNEAQSAATLNHPNVAQIYSFGQENGSPYLAMEYVPGGDLAHFMEQYPKKLDPAFLMRVGYEIAQGLKAAEEKGLFHGDVKPDNILFDEDGKCKLVDFGIASRSSQGKSDELWGTPYYIAPEKVQNKKNSARSDIYSLGATLYHAIAGRPPYDGPDAIAVIKARFNGPPRGLELIRPDVEPEVSHIISRMMCKDLFQRYPNYGSLLNDLEKYLKSVPASRSHGPKGGIGGVAKTVGASRADGDASVSQSGKKKFVMHKGSVAAAVSAGLPPPPISAASGEEAGAASGKVRFKTTRGGAVPPSADMAAGGEGAPSDGKGKKKGGNAKKAVVTFAIIIGAIVLGIIGVVVKVILDSQKAQRLEAQCVAELSQLQTTYRLIGKTITEGSTKDDTPEHRDTFDFLLESIAKADANMEEQYAKFDETVYEMTHLHFERPDIEPPPEPEPEAASPEGGVAAGIIPPDEPVLAAALKIDAVKNNKDIKLLIQDLSEANPDVDRSAAAVNAVLDVLNDSTKSSDADIFANAIEKAFKKAAEIVAAELSPPPPPPPEETADGAEPAVDAPAAPKKAPKPRRNIVAEYIQLRSEKAGYEIPQDMIVSEAQSKGMKVEEYVKSMWPDWDSEAEEEAEEEEDSSSEASDGFSSDAGGSSAPAAAADADNPYTLTELPSSVLDALEKGLFAPSRDVRAILRKAEKIKNQLNNADPPADPSKTVTPFQSREGYRKAIQEMLGTQDELIELRKKANAALRRVSNKGVIHACKPIKAAIDRKIAEIEARKALEAAEVAAQQEAERLAAIEQEEIARVQDQCRKYLDLVKEFKYDEYIEKLKRMDTIELTSAGAKEELRFSIDRIERLKSLRKWVLEDLRKNGDLPKGFRKKMTIKGLSSNGRELLLEGGAIDRIPVDKLKTEDWLRLLNMLLYVRPPSRRGLDSIGRGEHLFDAAIFFYLHGDGNPIAIDTCKKFAEEAFKVRTALKTDAPRYIPILSETEEEGSGEVSEGAANLTF